MEDIIAEEKVLQDTLSRRAGGSTACGGTPVGEPGKQERSTVKCSRACRPKRAETTINIVPPKNFSIDGETEVVPKEEKKNSEDEELLKNLYEVLENLKKQEIKLVDMISLLRKKLGFRCCQD